MTDLFGFPIAEEITPLKSGEVMSEVAPGQLASHLDVWELPSYVMSKLVPAGDGTYKLEMADEWFGWIPITEIRSKLGIKGMSLDTIRRLCVAGMIEHCQPTPQIFLIKIDSLVEHLERTKNVKAKEESWWTDQRRQLWRTTCGF